MSEKNGSGSNGALVVSPASEWRKRATEVLTLPSGLVMEARRPNVNALILNTSDGSIPTGLRNMVAKQLASGRDGLTEWKPDSVDDLVGVVAFMDVVVKACFVNPVIVTDREPDYDRGEISFDDVSQIDRDFLYNWASPAEVAAAQRFPEQQVPDVPAAHGSE